MIAIDDTMYGAIAAQLASRLRDTDYFNGTVEHDTEECHGELRCTLVLHRSAAHGKLSAAIPVWWEFHLFQAAGEVPNGFSWREFSPHLENCF